MKKTLRSIKHNWDAKRQVGDAASLNYNGRSTYAAIAHMPITKPFSCRILTQMSTRPFDRFWLVAVVLVASCEQAALGNTQTQKTSAQGPQSKPLVLMTYNVLADRIASTERMKSLFEIMEKNQPDILALQEVAPWFLAELLKQPWVKSGYHCPSFGGRQVAPGGLYIISKYPITEAGWKILSSKQQRTAMLVQLDILGEKLSVVTMHMESQLNDGPVRAKQLDQIFSLASTGDHAIVLGDFNFGDNEAEESHIPATYVDLWKTHHPKDPGYTWDIQVSAMAKQGSFPGEPSRRIDRILLRSPAYRSSQIKIIGNKALNKDQTLFPSDHFGLVGTMTRQSVQRQHPRR